VKHCAYAKPFDSIFSQRFNNKNVACADLAVYWYSMPGIWVWGMVIALHGAILFAGFRKSG
jgi:hypothetical protein